MRIRYGISRFSIVLIVMCICILVSCENEGSETVESIKNIPLPDTLSEETADLIVEGRINEGTPVLLDLSTVKKYPSMSFSGEDPWTNKEYTYTGVSLNALLKAFSVDQSASSVMVHAENDYSIGITLADIEQYTYILAYKIDNTFPAEEEAFTNRGTFFIAIDFSQHRTLDVEMYKHQLVWQVNRIVVE